MGLLGAPYYGERPGRKSMASLLLVSIYVLNIGIGIGTRCMNLLRGDWRSGS